MKNNFKQAFTLVELIVVITILAVLATVAFISFQGYTSSSRDSVRLADLKNISISFEINRTRDIDFPLPDKKIDITASGTIFQYQGELSQNILEKDLNIFDGGLDPVTKKPYGYAVNTARNKFQIIGFLENQESVANISASQIFADNTDKYVKTSGDILGILLDETTNEIIVQSASLVEIDVVNSSTDYLLKLSGNENSIYNQKKLISTHNLSSSCNNILKNNPKSTTGFYSIKIDGVNNTQVYCDMQTDGGGWTLIIKRKHSSNNIESCGENLNDFLHKPCNKNLFESGNYLDNISYSLGEFGLNLHTSEYMVQQYNSQGVLDEDDAYILTTKNNLFPDTIGLEHIGIKSVCSLDKLKCDTTDVVWKYVGNNHFNNSACNGRLSPGYGGNYGYCSNGADNKRGTQYFYYSNDYIGDRENYDETKLWSYAFNSKDYQELIFVR